MTGTSPNISGASPIIRRGEHDRLRAMTNTPDHPIDRSRDAGTPPPRDEHRDTVAMSEKGASMARIHEAAASASDVRADRVAELKARIQAGTYEVDTDAIAERMLDTPDDGLSQS